MLIKICKIFYHPSTCRLADELLFLASLKSDLLQFKQVH